MRRLINLELNQKKVIQVESTKDKNKSLRNSNIRTGQKKVFVLRRWSRIYRGQERREFQDGSHAVLRENRTRTELYSESGR